MGAAVLIVEDQMLIAWHIRDLVELAGHKVVYEGWGVRSIYVSANLDPETREQAGNFKPLGFVGKPFLAAELLDAIAAALREIGKIHEALTTS